MSWALWQANFNELTIQFRFHVKSISFSCVILFMCHTQIVDGARFSSHKFVHDVDRSIEFTDYGLKSRFFSLHSPFKCKYGYPPTFIILFCYHLMCVSKCKIADFPVRFMSFWLEKKHIALLIYIYNFVWSFRGKK